MRWGAALAAGILLLGGLTLWWMISGGDPGEAVVPSIVPTSAPLRDAEVPRRDARPIATEPLPSEEEVQGHPASGRWLLLRDEDEGRPLPGATLEILDAGSLEQSDVARELREHLATFEPGSMEEPRWPWRSLISDRRGLVRLPAFIDTLWVRHRGEDFRVLLESVEAPGWQDAVRPVTAESGRWMEVAARHGDGSPVPHALLILARECGDAPARVVPERFLVTDADGSGKLWVPEDIWGMGRVGWLGSGAPEGVSRSVDDATTALAFDLPSAGTLEVSFVGGGGARFSGPMLFDLEVLGDGEEKSEWNATNLYAEGGRAVVGGLPIASRFRLSPEPVDPGFESESVVFEGPQRDGEMARLAIIVSQHGPLVRGELRDAGDLPVARSRIALELQSPPPSAQGDIDGTWYRELVFLTDAEGRFSVPLLGEEPPAGTTWVRATQLEGPGQHLGRQGPRGETVRGALLLGINDLGVLTLAAQPVVVAGRVIDDAGSPVEGAWVYPAVQHAATVEEEAWWEFRNDRKVRSGKDGRFAIFDDTMRGSCRLDVEKGGYLWNRTASIATGRDDVEVTLVRGGWIGCRLLLDEGLEPDDVQAVILGPPARNVSGIPGEPAENAMMPGSRSYGDLFMWRGVNAGLATLSVRAFHAEGPELHRVEGIEVQLGAGTEDPRLHPLDLRGRIPLHVVALHDEEGPGLETRARLTFLGNLRRVFQVDSGVAEARFILLGTRGHLVVQAPGYGCWAGPIGTKVTRVRMERASARVVRLHLPAPLDVPAGAILQAEARLIVEGLPVVPHDLGIVQSGRPDAGGCVRLDLPHPGRYALELKLWSRANPASWLRVGLDLEITVPRGSVDHVHTLEIDPELLNRRMRQLISGR